MVAFIIIFIIGVVIFSLYYLALNREKIIKQAKARKENKIPKIKEVKEEKKKVVTNPLGERVSLKPREETFSQPEIKPYVEIKEEQTSEQSLEKTSIDEDDDFEEFMDKHSVTRGGPRTLAEQIRALPKELQTLIVTDVLKRKDEDF